MIFRETESRDDAKETGGSRRPMAQRLAAAEACLILSSLSCGTLSSGVSLVRLACRPGRYSAAGVDSLGRRRVNQPAKVKFRDPESGKTWSGRGRRPKWGRVQSRFASPASALAFALSAWAMSASCSATLMPTSFGIFAKESSVGWVRRRTIAGGGLYDVEAPSRSLQLKIHP